MSIRATNTGFAVDVSWRGTRVREYTESRAEAVALEGQIKSVLMQGKQWHKGANSMKATMTWERLLVDTRRNVWSHLKSGDTAEINARVCVNLLGANSLVKPLSPLDIDVLAGKLRGKGYTPATMNRKLSALRSLLKQAVKLGIIDTVPELPHFKEAQHTRRVMTEAEVDQLISRMGELSMVGRDITITLLRTGMRLGEVFSLRPIDVHQDSMTITLEGVATKGKRNRTIPMTTQVATSMRYYENQMERATDPMFPRHMTMRHYQELFAHARKAMGLSQDTGFVPHSLRHTAATRMLQAGVPIITVRDILGHKDIQTTLGYLHSSSDDLIKARDALDAIC